MTSCMDEIRKSNAKLEWLIQNRENQFDGILVSCKEAARLLGVTNKTISTRIKTGQLHKITIAGSTGIRLSEIYKSY